MKLGKGSIVVTSAIAEHIHVTTIMIIERVDGDKLVSKKAITSVNGGDFVNSKKLLPTYKGEHLNDVRLINGSEFNDLIDCGLVPRKLLKDLQVSQTPETDYSEG